MLTLETIVQRIALSAQVIALEQVLGEITREERDRKTQQMIQKNLAQLAFFKEIKVSEVIL